MNNLILLYLDQIMKGNITNINEVPKLYRKKVEAKLPEYGLGVDKDGNIYVIED